MTEYLLNPSCIVMNYHSEFGLHKMTLPTRKWSPTDLTGALGSFTGWDSSAVDAEDMVTSLVTLIKARFSSTVTFDGATVFDEISVDGPLIAKRGISFTSIVGTASTPGWYQAVEAVYFFRDTEFNPVKLVLLDTVSQNNFAKRTAATAGVDELAIADEFMRDDRAWASRAGFQPHTLYTISLGINDALKKQYPGI